MNTTSSLLGGLRRFALLGVMLAVMTATLAQAAPPQVLRVVGDDNYPPFLFRDPAGHAIGYVADWWALWAQKTGVKVELNATLWAEAQQIISRGDADVIDNIFRTPGREPLYDFTAPYAKVPADIFVHVSISGIQDVKDLHGFQVGVMAGDACIETLRRGGVESLRLYPSHTALIEAALADEVKLFCLDEYPANYYLYRENAQKKFRKAFQLYEGQFHRAVRKGDLETLRLVERGAAAISAEEDAALRAKWMPPPATDYGPYVRALGWILATLALVALVLAAGILSLRSAVRRKTAELCAAQVALSERVKEQQCLYAVFRASEDLHKPLSTLLEDVVRLLPDGWRYPEIAVARIEWQDKIYATADSANAAATLSAAIRVAGERQGRVTVAYLEPRPPEHEGPFLAEEHRLINAVAERLASVMQRRRLYQEAQKRESIFHAIVDQANDSIGLVDFETARFLEFNETAHRNLGYSREEFARLGVPDLEADMEPTTITAAFEQIRREGSAVFETRHRCKNGEVREVRVSTRLLRLHGQEYLASIWSDITERKAMVKDLRDSEERFRRLFEDTRQAITLTEHGRFVAANRAALTLLGLERLDQFVGLSPVDISPEYQPDGRLTAEKMDEVIRVAFENGSNEFEWEHIRADGAHFIARVLLTAIRQGDRDLLHVVWTDITAQKQAERELIEYRQELERRVAERTAQLAATTESLRLSKEEQQAVFDAATVGVALTRDEIIHSCNRTMERMFGYGPGEMWGLRARVWYPDEATYLETGKKFYAGLAQQGFYCQEEELVRKDGSRFWTRWAVRAIDPDDLSKGLAGTFEDITAERASFKALEDAKALAEDAARVKADFLANMSHEIRTPMNAIIGMTHLALKTELTDRQRDYLQKIQRSGQHLLGVINDVLDFSKIEAGKLVIEQVEFDLEQLLGGVGAFIVEKTTAKGLELILDIARDVPCDLIGDPLRISQILLNYANNAVKFTEQGEIALSVTVDHAGSDEAVLRFAVRDTGIGIAETQRSRLFQSFEQVDTSIARQYGGTGLGLAISKRLAELMGGEVGFDSTPGVGSTFWFTARFGYTVAKVRRLLPEPDLRGRRVLVVEDNASMRTVLVEMLRSMTFNVTAMDSGRAALAEIGRATAAGEPYEIVFLDWQMPELDGLATAREIRRLGLATPPRLAMITAYGREDLIQAAEDAGIEHTLSKPVTPSLLFDTAMHLLHQAPTQPERWPLAQTAAIDLSAIIGAHILLVEDNELNQEVATELLTSAGFAVDIAADGAVALRRVQEQHYDIVLMDMQMPVMDGLAATRAIRQLPGYGDLPIVAMTANAMAGDRERCIAAGMNDHIAKPIDPQDLTAKLLQWVKPDPQRARRRAEPAAAVFTALAPEANPPPDAIAGLDMALGLRQALGREKLYHRLLVQFAAGQADAPARLAATIAEGQWGEAERTAHTLKGVSAQIGALALCDLAERLEQALCQQAPIAVLEPLQAEIAQVLPPLVAAIAARWPQAAASTLKAPFDERAWRIVRKRLIALLEEDDAESTYFFEANEALLRAALGTQYASLFAAIECFDFATVLEALKNMGCE